MYKSRTQEEEHRTVAASSGELQVYSELGPAELHSKAL